MENKRILVIMLGGIGNMIMLSPCLKALRENFKNAYVGLLLQPDGAKELIKKSKFYDEIILRGSMIKTILKLRKKKFDTVIVSTGTEPIKAGFLSLVIGAKYRIGEDINKKGLFYNIKVPFNGKINEVEGNIKIFEKLGIEVKNKELYVGIEKEDEIFTEKFFRENNLKEVVGIHPGSGYLQEFKRWPITKFAELSNRITKKFGFKVIVFGADFERKLGDELERTMEEKPINLIGKTTLGQAAAIIKRCKVFVSNDSGLMHIAAAVKTPIVAIFGPTDPERYGPNCEKKVIIKSRLRCSPCYRKGKVKCKNYLCMKKIEVNEVFEGFIKILNEI